jgi:hypothetical protein
MIDTEKYKKKKLTISVDEDNNRDEMSYYEFSRWLSLLEAIDVVDKKATQLKLPKSDNSWIKPIAFGKYIAERTESMLFEITNENTV